MWRKLHPETNRYTFKRGNSNSRIDYISSSKMFPFSDHDIIITKLKTEDINRGLDIWIMNRETIKITDNNIMSK